MKTTNILSIILAICFLGWSQAIAQFSSGSTGADGPLNVTSNMTLNLPTNGIFNFTTINIASGVTLKFNRNALNTPVYLLATGDVVVNGVIDVSGGNRSGYPAAVGISPGLGGPGGFEGGFGEFQGFPPGDGQGPGGGKTSQGYNAAFAFPSANGANTNVYGNTLLSPLIGGSGGAAGNASGYPRGGGGGGGAILVASSTKVTIIAPGVIYSRGGIGMGGGSGGAVRIVAPVIDGSGTLDVLAGSSDYIYGNGSQGRTRIDSLDRFAHRNLTLGGKGTRGSQMVVFPPGNPHLDIIHAAGKDIAEGTNAPVSVTLPVGSSTNQIVRVQARGFTNNIPFRVKITPENAPSVTYDSVITNTGNPSVGEVTVTLPLDTVTYVHAWTR